MKSWDDKRSQVGAFESYDNAVVKAKKSGAEYKVYDNDGNIVYKQ